MRDTVISNFKRHQLVIPDNRLRKANPAKVEQIAKSIAENGLQSFIIVVARPGVKFELVAGLHRVMAMDSLDIQDYTAICYDADTPSEKLRMIEVDENLARNELSVLERAKFVAERKDLWDKLHGELRGGDRGNQHTGGKKCQTGHDVPFDFSEDTAELLGLSSRSIRRDSTISKNLAPYWDTLEGLPCQLTQKDLLKLAKLPEQKIKDALRCVEEAYLYPHDSDSRMQNLSFAIKSVTNPDSIKPTQDQIGYTNKRILTLSNIFNDVSNDALLDWSVTNFYRLEILLAVARAYKRTEDNLNS